MLIIIIKISFFYFQAGKDSKPHFIDPRASLVHKILIPIVILIAAGAAAPLFLITSDVAGSCYTCTNPISVTNLTKHNPDLNDEKFVYDLYSTLVTVFTYALPVLILPLSICIGKYLKKGNKKSNVIWKKPKKCKIASFSTYIMTDRFGG